MKRVLPALAVAAALGCRRQPPPPPPPAPAALEPAPPPEARPRPEVLVARARALRAEGDVAGARERLEAALSAAPDDEEARLELADLLVADGRELDRAASLLAGVRPDAGARRHLVAARLAEARGDDSAAEGGYALALAAEDDPELRLRRALALERLGRAEEATAELERVRAARPDDPVARSRLAERYEAAGRIGAAEAEYRWLAEAQPERPAPWERLGRFYERLGRTADARAALAKAREAAGRPARPLRPLPPSRR